MKRRHPAGSLCNWSAHRSAISASGGEGPAAPFPCCHHHRADLLEPGAGRYGHMLQRVGRVEHRISWLHLLAGQRDDVLDERAVGGYCPHQALPVRQGRLGHVAGHLQLRSVVDPHQLVDSTQRSAPFTHTGRQPGPHPVDVHPSAVVPDRFDDELVQFIGGDDLDPGKAGRVEHPPGLPGKVGEIARIDPHPRPARVPGRAVPGRR